MSGVTGKDPLGKAKTRTQEEEEQWWFPAREPTQLEKKNLLAAALEIGIRKMFSLHTYQFAGKLFQQTDGGPIGMRITGACARVVMAEWSIRVNEILKQGGVEVFLAGGYVDDIRYLIPEIECGKRWNQAEKKFTFKEEWKVEDEKVAQTSTSRTSRELGSHELGISEHPIHHGNNRRL